MQQELKQINVSIGRYFEGYTTIEIDLIKGISTYSQWGGSAPKSVVTKTLSEGLISQFLIDLDKMNLSDWDATYLNSETYEGTRWSVEVVTKGSRFKKYGQNMFPKEWDLFCDIVEDFALNNRKYKT